MSTANTNPDRTFQILLEELKARHAEILMLNQQIGAIYGLSVTAMAAAGAAIGVQSIVSGAVQATALTQSHRIASAIFAAVFISLLLLKNQLNSRIATQADYIFGFLRPRFEKIIGTSAAEFLTYEDFARTVRARRLSSKLNLRTFLFENAIIGVPILVTAGLALGGAILQLRAVEAGLYAALLGLGVMAWNSSGGLWLTLDELTREPRTDEKSSSGGAT